MKKIYVIGLTGVSGSGKTTVAEMLMQKGFAIINADLVSREVVKPGKPCLDNLVMHFGADIIKADGTLNRRRLAAIAFRSAKETEALCKITHPFINERIESIINEYRKTDRRVVILDAPQLFESGADKMCDFIVAVIADREVAKSRIIERDDLDEASAAKRISRALDDSFFSKNADYIIHNDSGLSELEAQVDAAVSYCKNALGIR